MFKKSLCYVVLVTMTLHCATRLGVLSFLYEKRHSIAYAVGLVAEIPIAICSSDYDFNKGLKISESDSDERIPSFAQADEITLYVVSVFHLATPPYALLSEEFSDSYLSLFHPAPPHSIFHPPSQA